MQTKRQMSDIHKQRISEAIKNSYTDELRKKRSDRLKQMWKEIKEGTKYDKN